MMLEAAGILGCFSALLLVVAIGYWISLFRGPTLQRLDGRIASSSSAAERASKLLLAAAASSALAAILAIAGFVAG